MAINKYYNNNNNNNSKKYNNNQMKIISKINLIKSKQYLNIQRLYKETDIGIFRRESAITTLN